MIRAVAGSEPEVERGERGLADAAAPLEEGRSYTPALQRRGRQHLDLVDLPGQASSRGWVGTGRASGRGGGRAPRFGPPHPHVLRGRGGPRYFRKSGMSRSSSPSPKERAPAGVGAGWNRSSSSASRSSEGTGMSSSPSDSSSTFRGRWASSGGRDSLPLSPSDPAAATATPPPPPRAASNP